MIVEGDNKQEIEEDEKDDKSVSVENKEVNLGGDSETFTKLAEVTRLRDEAEEKNKILSKEKEDAEERNKILSKEKEDAEERNKILSKEKEDVEERNRILLKEKRGVKERNKILS